MKIISVFVSYEIEIQFPKELQRFLDQVEVLRKIPSENQYGTIYQILHDSFPELKNESDIIPSYILKLHEGEFINGISL